MLIRRRLPDELSDDIVTWLAETGIYRMNKNIVKGFEENSVNGELELEIGEESFNFEWAELAPPSGAMAANYSRHLLPVILQLLLTDNVYLLGLFIGRSISHTSLLLPGQYRGLYEKIRVATSTTVSMVFGPKEVTIQLLHGIPHIFMVQASKITLPRQMSFLNTIRLGLLSLPQIGFQGFGRSMLRSRQL